MITVSLIVAAAGAVGILVSAFIHNSEARKMLVALIFMCTAAALTLYYTVMGFEFTQAVIQNIVVVLVFLALLYICITQLLSYLRIKKNVVIEVTPAAAESFTVLEESAFLLAVSHAEEAAKQADNVEADELRGGELSENTEDTTETEEEVSEEQTAETVFIEPQVIEEENEIKDADDYPEEKQVSLVAFGASVLGDIITGGHLRVMGKVKGDIDVEGDVYIGGNVAGDISCENIMVRGSRIIGKISVAARALIGNGTTLIGDIDTDTIHLDGNVKGNINAAKVSISSRSVLLGNITTRNISIKPGAVVNGRINTLLSDSVFDEDF